VPETDTPVLPESSSYQPVVVSSLPASTVVVWTSRSSHSKPDGAHVNAGQLPVAAPAGGAATAIAQPHQARPQRTQNPSTDHDPTS
jgi:hypothetical protein